jgi:hypothetical protein
MSSSESPNVQHVAEKYGPFFVPKQFGPTYPDLGPSAAKYRRMAINGLATMMVRDRRAYGEAVLTSVRSKQRQELQRELPSHPVHCPSGTNHNTGEAIIKAVQSKHRAALTAAASQERRARTPQKWREMYAEAMTEKIAREFAEYDASEGRGLTKKQKAAEPKTAIVKMVKAKALPRAVSSVVPVSPSCDKPATPKAGYEIVTAMQKGKFIVKVPPLPDGSKAIPEVIISNQIKCRFSHRDGGYLATADQISRLDRILEAVR